MNYLIAYIAAAIMAAIVLYAVNARDQADWTDRMLNATGAIVLGAVWPLVLVGLLVVGVGEAVRKVWRARD